MAGFPITPMNESGIQFREDHLAVISDLHLGNPAFLKRDYLSSFIKHLTDNNTSLCINGDGVDLLQSSTQKLLKDLQSAIKSVKDFVSRGSKKIYYVIGNHDIHLEEYLKKLDIFSVLPYLEVDSGDQKIHIEHGHIYDTRYRHFPKLYPHIARALGKLLKLSPKFFHLYFKIEWFLHELIDKKVNGYKSILLDSPGNLTAARKLFSKGFDIVILGHTHRHGLHIMEGGKILANAGAWTSDQSHYLEIQKGAISLKEWY
jgi:UDP-2,3-diacylglucosamine pyrophosphatase LpxH